MKVLDTPISGVKIIEPDIFRDFRGYFCETYNAPRIAPAFGSSAYGFGGYSRYKAAGITADFVQYNESKVTPEDPQGCAPKLDMPILLNEKDQRYPALSEIEPWEI